MEVPLLVNVSQDDIDYGHKWSKDNCPVALAVKRIFSAKLVHVTKILTHVVLEESVITYCMPVIAVLFIHSFDRGVRVEPTSFVLDQVNLPYIYCPILNRFFRS